MLFSCQIVPRDTWFCLGGWGGTRTDVAAARLTIYYRSRQIWPFRFGEEKMPLPPSPFSLTVPSDLRMIPVVRAFVEAVCQTEALDRNATHAIVMATAEAVSNVIRHAHQNRPELSLQICCRPGPGLMEVLVFDEGDTFDLQSVPHLDPRELRTGGRGVFLMRALMDELTCERGPERGNVLRMVKRCAALSEVRDCG
jgi:serine/threonine-protein kinase RsbW